MHLTDYWGLSTSGTAILVAAYFAAFFVKGALGVGALSPAILFGAYVLGPHQAVLVALTANALSQVQFISQGLRDGDWKIARQVVAANYLCAAAGIWIFGHLDGTWLTLVLGLVLGLVTLADLLELVSRLGERVDVRAARVVYLLAGATGLVSGVTGAGGIFFLALYLKHVCPDPRSFRGTTILLSTLFVLWRTGLLMASGLITFPIVVRATLLLPVVVFGGFAGARFFRSLPSRPFYRFFQIVVLAAAVSLTIQGLRFVAQGASAAPRPAPAPAP